MKVPALLRAGHKVSEAANLVGVCRTAVYSINKLIDDGESVDRRAGSGRKAAEDRDSLRDAFRRTDAAIYVRATQRSLPIGR